MFTFWLLPYLILDVQFQLLVAIIGIFMYLHIHQL